MKILLAILSLALISTTAFADPNFHANPIAFEHAHTNTIPEPGTLALFAVGIGALLLKLKK